MELSVVLLKMELSVVLLKMELSVVLLKPTTENLPNFLKDING
jgi:hypothetical protein